MKSHNRHVHGSDANCHLQWDGAAEFGECAIHIQSRLAESEFC